MKEVELIQIITDEAALLNVGSRLSQLIKPPFVLYLDGNLGAGKTTLTRGFLRGLHYTGKVKSPTYGLVEPYEFPDQIVFHFDLYRINSPSELAAMGLNDYFTDHSICLIEWPEKGGDQLPPADLICHIGMLPSGRELHFKALSPQGELVLTLLPASD